MSEWYATQAIKNRAKREVIMELMEEFSHDGRYYTTEILSHLQEKFDKLWEEKGEIADARRRNDND